MTSDGPGTRAARLSRPAALAFALAAAWLVGSALWLPPVADGDAGEYALMTVSLLRHLSPDVRSADVARVAADSLGHGTPANFVDVLKGYYPTAGGRRYSYHFWGYSLLAVPARLVLRPFGADPFKAFPLVNALCLLLALWCTLRTSTLEAPARAAAFALTLFSPALALLRWPHPEVYTYAMVSLALLWAAEGRTARAILAAALGASQNPPLVLLVAALWALGCRRALRGGAGRGAARAIARCSLAVLPALVPPLFYFVAYGTPSVVARESASWSNLSLGRALELFFDLDIGLLPYLPLTLALFLASVVAAALVRRSVRPLALAALLLLMALACSVTGNWNHGTSGPSRYAIWMLPLVFAGVLDLRANLPARRRALGVLLALAAASQGAIALARGGIAARPDYFEHSYAARAVLLRAPRLYRPSPEIFVTRTVHANQLPTDAPVAYVAGGGCRKALVRPQDRAWLEKTCGAAPAERDWFASPAARERGWQYVDYGRPLAAGDAR